VKKIFLLLVVLLLSACATTAPRTNIDYDPSVDFAQFKTYSWLDHNLAQQGVSPLVISRIIGAVDAQLQAKGWTKVPQGQTGQVIVAAGVSVHQQQSVNTYYNAPMYAGYGWGGPYMRPYAYGGMGSATTTVRTYDVGTLIIDMFASSTKQAIWRGTAEKTVNDSPQKNSEAVQIGIENMFRYFPPAPSAAK
jgi:hypothetical protein